MKHSFEGGSLYRLINVVLLLGYVFVILITILAGYIGYGERSVISATVNCADGTSWDALKPKNILYDSSALSGICTNRQSDGTYLDSNYADVDYSSYTTDVTKESWTWTTLIYPIITFLVGFGLVDSIMLIVFYIFTGRLALERSVLVLLLVFLNEDTNS